MSNTPFPPLFLKKNEERRLRAGHLWVFSNEVDTKRSSLKSFAAGDIATICSHNGNALGNAFVNPATLIAARVIGSSNAKADINWLRTRIERAHALRNDIYAGDSYRLVFGESDGLPGLVIDRFADTLVLQITTAGMEKLRPLLIDVLVALFQPQAIYCRNDLGARELEGLPLANETVHGTLGTATSFTEYGTAFSIPLETTQKTGWFFDQADNRQKLLRYSKGKTVLDVFSYVGAWAIQAMKAGAQSATCVDASQHALDIANDNAELNGVSIETLAGDAFDVIKQLKSNGRQFDIVIIDPPAFIKRKKDFKAGSEAYSRLNKMALDLIKDGGMLVSASCSHHLSRGDLHQVIRRAARQRGRQLQMLEYGAQGPDHPIHPAIPETEYLKAFFCRVL